MTVWREVEPLTRYEVWVTAKGYNNKQLADPTIKKITTKMSRFDYDETQVCQVDWPQTFKDEMVTGGGSVSSKKIMMRLKSLQWIWDSKKH